MNSRPPEPSHTFVWHPGDIPQTCSHLGHDILERRNPIQTRSWEQFERVRKTLKRKPENIQALLFLPSPPARSPGSYFPSTGNGGKANPAVFHACGVYKAARILNLNSIKIGFHLISGVINSWAGAAQRHWGVTVLLWQEQGWGSLGMLQKGEAQASFKSCAKIQNI